MSTGQAFTARPPHSEQNGALAVVDYVSGRALFPPHGTGGADLPPHVIEVGPNLGERGASVPFGAGGRLQGVLPLHLIRAGKCNRVGHVTIAAPTLGRSRRSSHRHDTTAAGGVRAASGGLFQFGLTARQLGGNRGGQGSKVSPRIGLLPHVQQHEVRNVRFVGKAFQTNGEDHERGY